MTYHDALLLAYSLDAFGHRTEVERGVGSTWIVTMVCGCDQREARNVRCPG